MTGELLTPENLRAVAGLELAARRTVQALLAGLHQSRRTGSGQTFSQYRSYQPGDDLRRLDWKLYARSDRFYIREAELDAHLTLRLVLDASASMRHADINGTTKMDYARYLIATLAWLAHQQGDALAFQALQEGRPRFLRPRLGRRWFHRLLHELLQLKPEGRFPDQLDPATQFSGRHGPELVVFISDLHEHGEELTRALRQLSQSPQEVLVFHLMARNEVELAYGGVVQLEDLESGQRVNIASKAQRAAYQRRLRAHLSELEHRMRGWGVTYQRIIIDTLPGDALRAYLTRRSRLR